MRESDVEAVLDALRSGWLTMGPRIQAFETAFAAYVGVPHAVAVSSGTAALHLAVRTVAGPGDEVLVPAIAGGAAAAAVGASGATPVVCDVAAPDRPTLDPADAAARRTDATVAAVAVHAYGFTAQLPADLPVIEDCRGALGTGVGTAGTAACWSFADGRALAVGEGGMVTTADAGLADRVRLLRAHAMTSGTWDRHRGHADSYDVVDIGFNFRLDEPRAALGSALLSHLDEDLAGRALRTAFYAEDPTPALAAGGRLARPLADRPRAAQAARHLVVTATPPARGG